MSMSDKDFCMFCCFAESLDIQAALDSGANANAKDENGRTALMYAAMYNTSVKAIKSLLSAGANAGMKTTIGTTVLHFAARANPNPDIIDTLLNAGVPLEATDSKGWTALMDAACFNSPEIVAALLRAGANVEARDSTVGETVLSLTSGRINKFHGTSYALPIVKMLLNAGANVNATSHYGGVSVLRAAAGYDLQGDVVETLINAGASDYIGALEWARNNIVRDKITAILRKHGVRL